MRETKIELGVCAKSSMFRFDAQPHGCIAATGKLVDQYLESCAVEFPGGYLPQNNAGIHIQFHTPQNDSLF